MKIRIEDVKVHTKKRGTIINFEVENNMTEFNTVDEFYDAFREACERTIFACNRRLKTKKKD